jgi:hypothetical protein
MWLLRLLAVILVIAIGLGLLLNALTGNRAWLTLAWRLFRWGLIFALLVFALMIIERVAVIPL